MNAVIIFMPAIFCFCQATPKAVTRKGVGVSPFPPDHCFEELNNCLERRMCYTRVRDLEMGCCKKSFVEGVYELEREKECMTEKILPDLVDCLSAMNEECVSSLGSFFSEKEEKFESLQKDIVDAVGIPENAECCENFLNEIEEMEWETCLHSQDRDLVWPCDLMQRVMKDTPLMKAACCRDFVQCITDVLPEPKVEEISISCCKDSVKNKTHFYDLQEMCCMKEMQSDFKKCFKSLEKDCLPKVISELLKDKDAIEMVRKAVEEIVGVPPNVLYCKMHYREGADILRGICAVNEDKNLDLFCSIVQHLYPSAEKH